MVFALDLCRNYGCYGNSDNFIQGNARGGLGLNVDSAVLGKHLVLVERKGTNFDGDGVLYIVLFFFFLFSSLFIVGINFNLVSKLREVIGVEDITGTKADVRVRAADVSRVVHVLEPKNPRVLFFGIYY